MSVVGAALRGFGRALKRKGKVSPKFEKHKQDVAKSTEKYSKGLTEEGKINVRKGTSKVLGKISNILKKGQ